MIFFTPTTKIVSINGRTLRKVRAKSLNGADLEDADLRFADLRNKDLANTILVDADLRFADLRNADLTCADLRSADLRCVDFHNADLEYADLRGADLTNSRLNHANLQFARLDGAIYHHIALGELGEVSSALRSDGFVFRLIDCQDKHWRVMAGCRWFTLSRARHHWESTRGGTDLGEETMGILEMFGRRATQLDQARRS